jgi:hypothetical protein
MFGNLLEKEAEDKAGVFVDFLLLIIQYHSWELLRKVVYFGSWFWPKVKGPHLVMAFLLAESEAAQGITWKKTGRAQKTEPKWLV